MEIRDRKVVLSVSGGKDSTAASLHLKELGIDHVRVFADTGWEHPATIEYIRGPLTATLGPISEVRGPVGFVELVRKRKLFPDRLKRFCTTELKMKPIKTFMDSIDEEVLSVVGIRAEESAARAKLSETEYSDFFDCEVWRPLLRWTLEDVISIHKRHGLAPNPLYLKGASRVGCWPCIHARKGEIKLVADADPGRIEEIRELESELSQMAASAGQNTERTMFWTKDRTGKSLPMAIDDAVKWSRTPGRRLKLVNEDEPGCVRWGMCDSATPDADA